MLLNNTNGNEQQRNEKMRCSTPIQKHRHLGKEIEGFGHVTFSIPLLRTVFVWRVRHLKSGSSLFLSFFIPFRSFHHFHSRGDSNSQPKLTTLRIEMRGAYRSNTSLLSSDIQIPYGIKFLAIPLLLTYSTFTLKQICVFVHCFWILSVIIKESYCSP